MTSLINKAKKPKFDLHLRIYDLNNVPLVSGVSQVKWHLPHSIHGEHRGRTDKRPIANHKVEYDFGRVVPLRIHIDRNNNLEECPIEFEVAQEFGPGEDRVVLGKVTLNLSEYVLESEEILRQRPYAASGAGGASSAVAAVAGAASAASAAVGDQLHHQAGKLGISHSRTRSSTVGASAAPFLPSSLTPQPASSSPSSKKDGGSSGGDTGSGSSGSTHQNDSATVLHPDVREGVVRRHLMQESKINSTLKIGILMIQIDGDRNFVAPALRTAPAFGGIAGLGVMGEQLDQDDTKRHVPTVLKHRDPAELDMYRTTLTASIASPPSQGELAADACIEDIFSGGTGFADPDVGPLLFSDGSGRNSAMSHRGVGFADDSNDVAARANATNHRRQRSGRSGRSGRFSATSSLAPPSPWGNGNGSGNGSPSSADDDGAGGGAGSATLRPLPRDARGFFGARPGDGGARPSNHRRQRSGASDKSARTLIVSAGGGNGGTVSRSRSRGEHDDNTSNNNSNSSNGNGNGVARRGGGGVSREPSRARSGSLVSLATTTGGDSSDRSEREHRGRDGFRRAREVDEFEVRDDLVAWRLPGKVS